MATAGVRALTPPASRARNDSTRFGYPVGTPRARTPPAPRGLPAISAEPPRRGAGPQGSLAGVTEPLRPLGPPARRDASPVQGAPGSRASTPPRLAAPPTVAELHAEEGPSLGTPAASAARTVEALVARAEREGKQTWVQVLPELVQHLEKLPESQALAYLARAHAATGNVGEALKAAREALRLDPSAALAYGPSMLLAQSCMDAGNWQAAARQCEQALACRPGDADAAALLSRAQASEGGGSCKAAALKAPTAGHVRSGSGSSFVESVPERTPQGQSPRFAGGGSDGWRDELVEGQSIEVYSKSALRWIDCSVIYVQKEYVKVSYAIDGSSCEKVLLRSSDCLRPRSLPAVNSAAVPVAQGPAQNGALAVIDEHCAHRSRTPPPALRVGGVPAGLAELLNFADLHLGEVLGAGSFGSVYRGTYKGEEVAIKKLHPSDGQVTPTQLAEFKKEVFNLMALKHPRLTRFIGAAFNAPHLCIVVEFMPNGSLHALLHEKQAPLAGHQRLSISIQSTEGVKFLHSLSPPFVHRDLKSMNVVLDYALNAKLCDFGLAQTMESTHISRRTNEVGSPRYMAPELFDAQAKITEKVDIWALGCLVVEVFTCKPPHEECTTVQQVMSKLLVKRQLPFREWQGLSSPLLALADSCFEFRPQQRVDVFGLLEGLRQLTLPA